MVEPGKEVFREAGRVIVQPDGQNAEPDEQYVEEPEEAEGDEP